MDNSPLNRTVLVRQPKTLVFGNGCMLKFADDFISLGFRRAMLVCDPHVTPQIGPLLASLKQAGIAVTLKDPDICEPTITDYEELLEVARAENPDALIGIGGGSVLDAAKLVAALLDGSQQIHEVFGIDLLKGRSTYLACLPTTSGTGSEVSPIAVLLDEPEKLKKGAVSSYLVPDATYVDPLLTLSVPPDVTAATGVDAMIHCIESYANKFAHPIVDLYALEGIRLVGQYLLRAVTNGNDTEARSQLSLGSMYGGLCLGPVNTGAVHALSYPLGGEFHIAHGVSNSLLLPYVLEFNLPAGPERYAQVALALGVEAAPTAEETARLGLERIRALCAEVGIPPRISDFNVPDDAIDRMATAAMTVTRLLKNNLREVTLDDAKAIYEKAF